MPEVMANEVPWIRGDVEGEHVRAVGFPGNDPILRLDFNLLGMDVDDFPMSIDAAKQLRDQIDAALAEVEGEL